MSEIAKTFLDCRMMLARFVGRILKQPQDIEDIVQETFVRTYAAGLNGEIDSPKAFLFKTAWNLALKHQGRAATRLTATMGDSDLSEVLVDELSAERRVEAQENFLMLCQAVRDLPLQCRRVFLLRKVYDLSYLEIAARLGISTSTVEKHMLNGITKCGAYLCAHGYERGAGTATRPRKARS
ncbi:MAG TPA: RNA polymerase sigma factor [Gammaproteobacteria bacterium]|nr:RNA polymerase sigma factor [Gammaproteobacteria bacterium]